jgi:hypothetical protein
MKPASSNGSADTEAVAMAVAVAGSWQLVGCCCREGLLAGYTPAGRR